MASEQIRSPRKVLLLYALFRLMILSANGFAFAVACSMLANLCASIPLDNITPGTTASFVKDLLQASGYGRKADRLSRLCIVRLALSLTDIDIQDSIIKGVGFDPFAIRDKLKWHSSIATMIDILYPTSEEDGEWAFVGKARDAIARAIRVCIFSSAALGETFTLIEQHGGERPIFAGATKPLHTAITKGLKLDNRRQRTTTYGFDKRKHTFRWEDKGRGSVLDCYLKTLFANQMEEELQEGMGKVKGVAQKDSSTVSWGCRLEEKTTNDDALQLRELV